MPTNVKLNGVFQVPAPTLGRAERSTAAPDSRRAEAKEGAILDDVSIRRAQVLAMDTLQSQAKVHDVVIAFHVAQQELGALGSGPGRDVEALSLGLASAFSQLEKLAQSMREAGAAVLENGPLPNREAAEYIAKMLAENAARRSDIVGVVAGKLTEQARELAS